MSTIRALVLSSVLAVPALAHHSDAGLDMNTTVTFEGTIKEFHFRNPHMYFIVEADNPGGEPVEWSIQSGSAIGAARRGWSRDTLQPGDRVLVAAHPTRNGNPYGILESIDKEGGLGTGPGPGEVEVTASATSLEGRWLAKFSEVPSFPGGIDGFFNAQLVLTAKGEAAKAAYDPLSPENPESQCIGRPSPGMLVSSTRYPIEISFNGNDTVTIRSQYWDEVRTVYMDGREHPADSERTHSGHSIGRWDGDTLVVDTRNFADHRSPYQVGVPSGAQKHVVERYRLVEGGTRVAVEFTLEDAEYLAAPLIHARELIYVPDIDMTPFECDMEATSRFLRTEG
ncbi:MAG: hypothetical protein HKN84_02230 [Gammaproteobacteria bacterium]|nr:hypothetical protein [Gammaproteobacteria bacterium]